LEEIIHRYIVLLDPIKALTTTAVFHANGTKLADIPCDTITVVFNIPAASPWIVIPRGGAPYYIIYTIDYKAYPTLSPECLGRVLHHIRYYT